MAQQTKAILTKASFGVSMLALVCAASAVYAQQAPPLVAAMDKATAVSPQVSRHTKAAKTPSNTPSIDNLYKMLKSQGEMIKGLQAQQTALIEQTRNAQAKSQKAEDELAATRQALEDAQAKIATNTVDVQKATETIKVATIGLEQMTAPTGETVMGSQLSTTAVTVRTAPDGWFADASIGAVFVGDDGHDFAIFDPDDSTAATGIDGELNFASDDEAGVQVTGTIGRRDATGKEVRATLAYANFNNSDSCVNPDAASVCFIPWVNANANGPDPDNLDQAGDNVQADLKITKVTLDLEAGKTLALGTGLDLTITGGARLARVDHDFDRAAFEAFAAGTPIDNSILQESSNELTGAGATASANMIWRRGNLTLRTGARGSLLAARRDYSIRETADIHPGGTPTKNDGHNFDTEETLVLPIIGGYGELSWDFLIRGQSSFITFGYNYQSWLDAIRAAPFQASGSEDGQFIFGGTHDLTFHGPYIKAGIALGGDPYRGDPIK